MNFYEIPKNLASEINTFEQDIKSFLSGEINPVKFRAIRVPFGIYEQRKENTFMIRIRCTAGGVTPAQLHKVAELAKTYGSGFIHVTTRQELQIHSVLLENVITVLRELLTVNLSTRGGGGNTVRNIMASYDAGISPDEVFDVTPYAVALTSRLIAESDSWNLPRKYKITFSGHPEDNANATVQDLGFIAQEKDGQNGFKVFVAGGMGAKPMVGQLLYDFVPDTQVYTLALAVKRLFDKHGNRRNKHAARLRFVWQEMGREEFVKHLEQEIATVKQEGHPPLKVQLIDADPSPFPLVSHCKEHELAHTPNLDDFEKWQASFAKEQRQDNLFQIKVPLYLGDISSTDAIRLAELITPFGEDTIRGSMDQNFYLRNIPKECLKKIYKTIIGIAPLSKQPAWLSEIIACTGADTCKLGICLPQGLTTEIYKQTGANAKVEGATPNASFKIHISGCPNSCGQHWSADLGFYGRAGRKDGKAYPSYTIVGGAHINPKNLQLAEAIGEISAHDLPDLINSIRADYLASVSLGSFKLYLDNGGKAFIQKLCESYNLILPSFDEDPTYYTDWSANEEFSIGKLGQGECTAGLFDMIGVDQKLIQENRIIDSEEALFKVVFSASRMLLVTKGIDTKTEAEVFEQFISAFIDKGLIAEKFSTVVETARNKKALSSLKSEVLALADAVIALYESMDNSLKFPGETTSESGPLSSLTASPHPPSGHPLPEGEGIDSNHKSQIFKDFRGVACPMNFVKTKMALMPMKSGEILEILLDDGEPMENVPRSVEGEGHKILEQTNIDGYWKVVIEKG